MSSRNFEEWTIFERGIINVLKKLKTSPKFLQFKTWNFAAVRKVCKVLFSEQAKLRFDSHMSPKIFITFT